ncbi:MAG: carboxypeptidase regulatory-like domain-containing protein [Candidatus Delongbacteria bacterium]|nr:carboxypeptidase regulatory-like domain-containing protein [Candidatus Delongbacteria bacterium]MCG2760455.1 carboxypeptidase regulatory-like domain-containing protein [Candidatus Delongbacteria bacterium]
MNKLILIILIASIAVSARNKYQYAEVKVSSLDDIKFLQENNIDIDRTSFGGKGKPIDGKVTVYVTEEQFKFLKSTGYSIKWTPLEIRDKGSYRDNTAIGDSMNIWQTRWPDICKRLQIGTSVQSRPLWVLKISDNVNVEEAEPELKFVSTMHGDEVTGMEMEMFMIENILRGYQANNDTMRFIVNNTELYVMPLMNPDGNVNNSRYNANGYDLNRNFPEGTLYEPNTPVGEEPEIAAMINFSNQHNFVLSTNYHGGALVANYEYDTDFGVPNYAYAACPDDPHVTWLAYNYSQRNTPMFNSSSFTDGITNGNEWYMVQGGMQDWNYRYYNDLEITLEISETKWPSYSYIPGFWADNRSSMFWLLSAAHKGIYGTVTDSSTGLPLSATIQISDINKDYFTDPDLGDYYRVLKPGTYSMTVSATGYYSQTINNIIVTDPAGSFRTATLKNVQLIPEGVEGGTFALNTSSIPFGNISVGSSGTQQFQITNSHSTEIMVGTITTITGYSASEATKDSQNYARNTFDYYILPNTSKTFNLLFEPTAVQTYNGNITITSSDSTHATECIAVTGTGVLPTFGLPFSEDFNASASLPVAWQIIDNQGNGQVWTFGTHSSGLSGAGNYAYLNSDAYGSGNSQNSDLVTPLIDMSNAEDVTLSFTHYFNWYSASDSATISYSINGGSTWTPIQSWTVTTSNPASFSQAINAADGQSEVKFKWNYTGSYGWYWDVDDILITGTITIPDVPGNMAIMSVTASEVNLSWDAVSGATLYRVYRSVDPYSGFVEVATPSVNSYIDTDVIIGNKYFYYITADNVKIELSK